MNCTGIYRELSLPRVEGIYIWLGYPHKCSRIAIVKRIVIGSTNIEVVVKHQKCLFSEKYSIDRFWQLYSGPKINYQIQP